MSAYEGFFRQSIFDFYANDIKSCLKVSEIKQSGSSDFQGGLNFTAALAIFCVLEMMAGFYKGKKEPTNDDIVDFLVKYFSKYDSKFADKDFAKLFYKVFRHGLVHEWSPKASAIAMNFRSKEITEKIKIKTDGEEIMCVNIPPFFDITIKAYTDYKNDLDKGMYVEEFERRYQKVTEDDYYEMRVLRAKFDSLKTKL